MVYVELIVGVILACTVFYFSFRKPTLVWPLLIIVSIFGEGIRFLGQGFYDELLCGAVVLAIVFRFILEGHDFFRLQKSGRVDLHKLVFSLYVVYMLFQSVRGMITLSDPRMLRWILFHLLLGILAYLTYYENQRFCFPSWKSASRIILITSLIYYGLYLTFGLYNEIIFGEAGRFKAQFIMRGFCWAGPAVTVFTVIITMPIAVVFLNSRLRLEKFFSWLNILLLMVVGLFYDTRVVWISVLAYLFAAFTKIKLKQLLLFFIIFLLVFGFFIRDDPFERIGMFMDGLLKTVEFLWAPQHSDISRNLQFKAAFLPILENTRVFLFGYGMYTHRYVIVPYMKALFLKYLPHQNSLGQGVRDDTKGNFTIYRTTGFTAMMIDTGVLGMGLLLMNFLCVIYKLLINKNRNTIFFILTLVIAFLWLLVCNIIGMLLFYLLIIPRGLLEQLNKRSFELEHAR